MDCVSYLKDLPQFFQTFKKQVTEGGGWTTQLRFSCVAAFFEKAERAFNTLVIRMGEKHAVCAKQSYCRADYGNYVVLHFQHDLGGRAGVATVVPHRLVRPLPLRFPVLFETFRQHSHLPPPHESSPWHSILSEKMNWSPLWKWMHTGEYGVSKNRKVAAAHS